MSVNAYDLPAQKALLYGIPVEVIAATCRVTTRSAWRWKSGKTPMPAAAKMILAGDLGCFDPQWSGWVIRHGELVSPEGWTASAGDVLALPLLRAQLHVLQVANRALRDLAESFPEEQPAPGELPAIRVSAS